MVHEQAVTALEALAAALPGKLFSAALTTGPSRPPRLAVLHRDAPSYLMEISAEGGWYWWSWGERIAATTEAGKAAEAVAALLQPRVGL